MAALSFPSHEVSIYSASESVNYFAHALVIGASLSEPHTSESNGGFIIYIYIYIFIYLPYVRRSVNAG